MPASNRFAQTLGAATAALAIALAACSSGQDQPEVAETSASGAAPQEPTASADAEAAPAASTTADPAGAEASTPGAQLGPDLPQPVEQRFLAGRSVGPQAHSLLQSADFDALMNQMARGSMAAGVKNSALYRAASEETLAGVAPGQPLQRMECGAVLCVMSLVESPSDHWFEAWWGQFPDSVQLPTYVLVHAPMPRADGSTEHRVLFTTSPEYNRVAVPPTRTGG